MSPNKEVDLMEVLAKYIAHVSLEESVNFINTISGVTGRGFNTRIDFTEEELEALYFAEDLAHSKYINE